MHTGTFCMHSGTFWNILEQLQLYWLLEYKPERTFCLSFLELLSLKGYSEHCTLWPATCYLYMVSENQNIGLVRARDEVPSENHPAGALPHLRRQLDVLQEWRQRRG